METKKDDLVRWLKLCNVKGLGPRKILRLFELFGDINSIFEASDNELLRTRIFNELRLQYWKRLKEASSENFEKVIFDCELNDIKIVPLFLNEYPSQLKLISDPPLNLFLKGDIDLLKTKKVAIVGSRESNEKARKWSFLMAKELAKKKVTIVSGGAKGIDYEAHEGALSMSGQTICVVGTGLLRLYPEEHKDLFEKISKQGLLISENLPNFTGGRIALLQRNRITSGLSDALLSVSSSNGGGSMTQLKLAYEQRVPIFCPKLSLNLLPNEGIKEAIKEYKAIEIENIEHILNKLDENKSYPENQTKLI